MNQCFQSEICQLRALFYAHIFLCYSLFCFVYLKVACIERFHVIILRKPEFLIAGDGVSRVILFCGSVVNVFLSHISYA
jgi:hypothetical protein